jgi:AAA15 family ATPase/GTPase
MNRLFNLEFAELGDFENVVNNKNSYKVIDVSLTMNIGETPYFVDNNKALELFKYRLSLAENSQASIEFSWALLNKKIEFTLPTTLKTKKELSINNQKIIWNGLTFEQEINTTESYLLCSFLNFAYEYVKDLEIVPPKRGFSTIIFSKEQLTTQSIFALEVFNNEIDIEGKADYYFQKIFDKSFFVEKVPGTEIFYLRVKDRKGLITDIINEGYGVNSVLDMLLRLLKTNTSLAFIEEPEIHLHPSAQAKLVDVFAEIVQKENKQIFLTTHSENIVSSVLAKIANGELDKNDVQFYLAKMEDDETKIIPQEVNDKGQIEGGLMNFMETELSNLKTLLGV